MSEAFNSNSYWRSSPRNPGHLAAGGIDAGINLEALPMIVHKYVSGGMEFLITVGVSAVAGVLAFLLVSIVAHLIGAG